MWGPGCGAQGCGAQGCGARGVGPRGVGPGVWGPGCGAQGCGGPGDRGPGDRGPGVQGPGVLSSAMRRLLSLGHRLASVGTGLGFAFEEMSPGRARSQASKCHCPEGSSGLLPCMALPGPHSSGTVS